MSDDVLDEAAPPVAERSTSRRRLIAGAAGAVAAGVAGGAMLGAEPAAAAVPDDASVTPAKFHPTAIDAAAGVPSARTLGTGPTQAAPGPAIAAAIGALPELAAEAGLEATTVGGTTTLRTSLTPSTILARLATGDATNASPAEVRTLLNVADKSEDALGDFLLNPAARLTAHSPAKNADTTLSNVTGLSVLLLGGFAYNIRAYVLYMSSFAADLKLGWVPPAGATGEWTSDALSLTAAGVEGSMQRGQAVWTAIRTAGGASVAVVAKLEGTILVPTNGNLQLQFAQNTSDPTNTTIRANSHIIGRRINAL